MTDREINKLIGLINKGDLNEIRKILLDEKIKNKQKLFETYLTTPKQGYYYTRICEDENSQKFTNGISLYIINKKVFDLKTPKIIKNIEKERIICTDKYKFSKLLSNIRSFGGDEYHNIEDYTAYMDGKTVVEHSIEDCFYIDSFSTEEIEYANKFLDNPLFTISNDEPILKAEGSNGKAYILGHKR